MNRRSESELLEAENDAVSACVLVGTDVAMVHAKGTNDDRDECDKRILLYSDIKWLCENKFAISKEIGSDSIRVVESDDEVVSSMVVKIRRLVSGSESVSYNFSPSTRGVPDEFLMIPDIAWRDCGAADLNGAVRRYVEYLRENGESVEVAVSDSGIVRFDLLFKGERRSLWFNAYT